MQRLSSTIVLAIMIIMMPLRGWLGDAMAVEMVKQHLTTAAASVNATNSGAAYAHSTLVTGHLAAEKAVTKAVSMPCHEMSGDSAPTADNAVSQTDNTPAKTSCTSCQVCHLSALTVDTVTSVSVHTAHAPLAFAPQYWASAELPQATKPPVL